MVAQSETGGVKPMSIAGRYVSERERLYEMTDAERAFRKQWLNDQILSANEPKKVPEMYKAYYNPIRRFYRWPLDKLQTKLEPALGYTSAYLLRYFTGKVAMGIVGVYAAAYYWKYNSNNWMRKAGWKAKYSKLATDIGDKDYPKVSDRSKPSDYADRGFSKNTLKL